MRYERQPLP